MAIRRHATLTGGAARTLILNGSGIVMVTNHSQAGTDAVYFTVDGSTPTVQGDDMLACQPGGQRWLQVPDQDGTILVIMISAGAPAVSAELVTANETPGG